MLVSTEGIVLKVIKYGESSLIATLYTKDFGRSSYIINAVRGRKARHRQILQPLFLVEVVAYVKDSREVQRVKEIKNDPVYQNIPFDIRKSTQILFLSEVLNKILREQESSPEMFDFIKNSLLFFDLDESSTGNFHLFFLLRLTGYLGFLPDMHFEGSGGWLDLQKGVIVPYEPSHPYYVNQDGTAALQRLSVLKSAELNTLRISRSLRRYLTLKIIEYYHMHFEHLGEIKSLKILQELFE
jgi:DNA repair protein RecO (recombination protein O)